MDRITKRLFCFLSLFGLSLFSLKAQLHIAAATCENKTNPSGVSLNGFRFSWESEAKENDQYQTAYQVVLASSKEKLEAGNYDIYNSSIVRSRQSVLVEYKGRRLQPGHIYYWKLRVWDKYNQVSGWSDIQSFITGLFSMEDWRGAAWIGYRRLSDTMRIAPGMDGPKAASLGNKGVERAIVPLFRKEFTISKKVKEALLFVTGLGQYTLSLNGQNVGNAFLAPGWTDYDKTCLYNTYEVKDYLGIDKNVIGLIVGNGFYNINRERYFKLVTAYGLPEMICRLKIIYQDGSMENIVSGRDWKAAPSPITYSSIYGGEDDDARREQKGWDRTAFDDSGWEWALLVKAPRGRLTPENDYPVILSDSFPAKRVLHPGETAYVYDFGQNISGIIRLQVKGRAGQTIRLIPAELLDGRQMANQSATGNPYYFSYTLKGGSTEVWQPAFTYYGFRYVQVEGALPDSDLSVSTLPRIIGLQSLHNQNANPVNGSFTCSNALFNRVFNLIDWAIRSNMQSVITDCPHREKLSWLEQDYLMGASIHYNYDIYSLYRKLVFDLKDAQYQNGFVPDIAPEYVVFGGGFHDSPEWGSSSVILPWLLYSWYGDKAILREAFPMMKRYVAYLTGKSNKFILTHGLGDWYDYGPKPPGQAQLTPKAVTATAIYFYDAILLRKMAGALGQPEDVARYGRLAGAIKTAFNERFFDTATKVYSTGSQTAMAMPLSVGLVDERYEKQVFANLEDSIYSHNKALTAGDIGFHFLMDALDGRGASQLIYDMNNRDDVPGYGYQLKKGATSLTESWQALENVSNNHLMLGHIMEWFYRSLAGIGQEENSIAYHHIDIHPQPVGDLTYAKGNFHSPYGWIRTDWKKENGKFHLGVEIPVNAMATVELPATRLSKIYVNGKMADATMLRFTDHAALIELGSGTYDVEVKEPGIAVHDPAILDPLDSSIGEGGNSAGFDMAPETRTEVVERALKQIPTPMPAGPFQPTWESIKANYKVPDWFVGAKFGLFMHWGLFSVPAHKSEWYEKHMYGNRDIMAWHEEHFGSQDKFGYKDFIPLFTQEKFDPDAWAELFKRSGAKFVIPTAEHHENFAMWDSQVTPYNAKQMGPKRDLIGELCKAVRKQGLKFGVSNHGIENFQFINPPEDLLARLRAEKADLFDPKWADFYNVADRSDTACQKFLVNWFERNVELIDKYQPDILWFDNGVDQRYLDPLKLKIAAYYYNRAKQWGKEVSLSTKKAAYAPAGTNIHTIGSILDFEGRIPPGIRTGEWQVDYKIGSTWGYTADMHVAGAGAIIGQLVDIVSKNGTLLLNLSPRADGSFPPDQQETLINIGKWLEVNGEAIYDTHNWTKFGETGPNGSKIRYTVKGDVLYVIIVGKWSGGTVLIPSLAEGRADAGAGKIVSVTMPGIDGQLAFTRDGEGLKVVLPVHAPCDYAYTLKISGLVMNPPTWTGSGNPY